MKLFLFKNNIFDPQMQKYNYHIVDNVLTIIA